MPKYEVFYGAVRPGISEGVVDAETPRDAVFQVRARLLQTDPGKLGERDGHSRFSPEDWGHYWRADLWCLHWQIDPKNENRLLLFASSEDTGWFAMKGQHTPLSYGLKGTRDSYVSSMVWRNLRSKWPGIDFLRNTSRLGL